MSEPVTAPDAAPAAPAADPAAPKPATPSRAAAALAAFRAKRAAAPAAAPVAPVEAAPAGDPAAAPAIPAEIADAAKRWSEHIKAETARIATLAEGLSDEDKALIAGVPDVAMKAKILERLKGNAEAAPVKEKAKPRAAGGPPPASTVDFSSALKDPQAMADAKARDPQGLKAFLSRAMNGTASRSTLDRGRA